MQKLIAGLRHFMDTVHASERALFHQLAYQQSPEVLFITCSDSRVSPNLMTQSEPGELFVVRNAGNIVPPYGSQGGGEAPSIEYAVAVLGVRDVVVCGHSNCGAMRALLAPETCAHLPAVSSWLASAETTRRIMATNHLDLDEEARLARAVEVNVLAQIANLQTHPSVAAGLASGQVRLHGWTYDIGAGVISAYDTHVGAFVPITDHMVPVAGGPLEPLGREAEQDAGGS